MSLSCLCANYPNTDAHIHVLELHVPQPWSVSVLACIRYNTRYVYVQARMYVRVCMHARMYVYTGIQTYTCSIYIYTHTYIKLYNMRDYICMYGCTRIYIYIYIYIYLYLYLYIYIHTHTTYTYAYTYTPVYLCMYIYIHTARYMQHEPAQLSTLHAFLVYVFAVT